MGELHSERKFDNKHMLFTHMIITLQYNKYQVYKISLFMLTDVMDFMIICFITWFQLNVHYLCKILLKQPKTTGSWYIKLDRRYLD